MPGHDDVIDAGTDGALSAGHTSASTSLALRDIPVPDYCDVVIVPTRGVDEPDPRAWAEAIFSHENTPLGRRGLLALRDEAVRLFDMVPPPAKEYVADEVVGSEALIRDDDEDLLVRIGVALLPGGRLLQVTTAVKYRSLRGRLAFGPRRLMHAAAVNTLARRAPTTLRRRSLAGGQALPAARRNRSVRAQAVRKALGRGASSTDPR
ncbi:hypothetical protein [Brachybacterium epidermidis]|uniref:hypothetical protein n=1 Tax=Brachybacterium epidermidis TaxID=2781983 RepID=UPI00398E93AD